MAASITFSSRAAKDLVALTKSDPALPEKLREAFLDVSAGHMQHVKKLEGNHRAMYRLRVGVFRALFVFEADYLLVVKIAHRKESYR